MKDFLKQLTCSSTHTTRIKLVQKEFLGTRKRHGSARICIPLNDKWVLKVARNEKGIAQNKFESECYKYATLYQKRFLAKVKQSCICDTWLIQQRVTPLQPCNREKLKETFLRIDSFRRMILDLEIEQADIDQIGRIGKRYKLYDYGLSPYIFKTYY